MGNISDKFCRENKHTYVQKFIFENRTVYGKFGRAGQVTDENIAHAHYMLDN